jgi:hypothetical protein
VQAESWPFVRAAAATRGAYAEIAATSKYLEALLKFAGADCQRTSDAARALVTLIIHARLPSAQARSAHRQGGYEATSDVPDIVSSSLQSLVSALESTQAKSYDASAVSGSSGESESAGEEADSSLVGFSGTRVLLGASETAELVSAIQRHLEGSSTRKSSGHRSMRVELLNAEHLREAKPSQIVHVATTCEFSHSSGVDSQRKEAGIGKAQSSSVNTGDEFMALAQVCARHHHSFNALSTCRQTLAPLYKRLASMHCVT